MANKQQKTCFIVRRYFIKRTGSVCCVVRNGRGDDYITCIHANGTTACDCGARKGKCYHRDHVLAAEQARKQCSISSAPAPQVTSSQQVVKQTVRSVISRSVSVIEQ